MAPFKQTTLPAHLAKPYGRSAYKDEYANQVVELMGQGLSLTAFAGAIGHGRETIYGWIRAVPAFSDAVSRARAARVLHLERKLLRARKGAESTAAIFALKNAAPDEWRDVKQTEHRHSLSIDQLTTEQLHAIAAGVAPADVGVIEGDYQVVDK